METKQAIAAFAALAQETRLAALRALVCHGATGLPAGELAHRLAVAPSTLSFHLATLEQAGLVASARQGRHIVYAVRFAGLHALLSFLTETCCNGRPELCGDIAGLLPGDCMGERTMSSAFEVLFICTRNSARSIMAEAILDRVGRDRFNAYSAGSRPAAAPMPEVIDRLVAMGHDVARLRPKSWNGFTGPSAPRMDFVITLCDPANSEACPEIGDKPITANWPFPDPARFKGSAAEKAAFLNELYGMIRRRLRAFASLPFDTLDRMALKARMDELGDSEHMARQS